MSPAPAPVPAPGSRSRALRRRLAIATLLVAAVGALLAVPARGYLDQRAEVRSTEAALARLEAENERLERRRAALDDPEEIQRIARRDYGLVGEGEESYMILPPPTAGVVLPHAWPFDRLAESVTRAAGG